MTYLGLRLLRHFALEAFGLYSLLEHRDFVLVEALNCIDHFALLLVLLFLGFPEFFLFFEKLVFFKLASQLVDFLAEADLLCVAFVHKGLLLVDELLLKLLFADLSQLDFSLDLLLDTGLLEFL